MAFGLPVAEYLNKPERTVAGSCWSADCPPEHIRYYCVGCCGHSSGHYGSSGLCVSCYWEWSADGQLEANMPGYLAKNMAEAQKPTSRVPQK